MRNGIQILQKLGSLILALVMLLGMLPRVSLRAHAEEVTGNNSFAGETVSILSHSMSTYTGVSNNTAYNSTIGNNDVYYTEGRHGVYQKDTWWQQAIDALGMELCVNNSWSGSCIFQPRKGAASVGYGDRAVNLHNDRTGEEPDVIWVYMGGNDFAYYKDTFGKADSVDYAALIQNNGDGSFAYAVPQTTCEAYAIMLHKVATRYPDAEIYCMTSTARRETDYTGDSYPDAGQPTEYSVQLQKIATYFGYPVIDLEKAIPKEVEIFDKYMGDKRAHANALGMDQITNQVLSVMLGRDAEIRHITSEDGTVTERAVLLGGSYETDVNIPEGYTVSVTMDGRDVSETVYSNGKIRIEEVTGDIEVSLKRGTKNFRWELKNDVFDSANKNGFSENHLTLLEGNITDGIFSGVKYALAENIILHHDQPWIVEWACTGNWDATLFAKASTGGIKDSEFLFRSSTDYQILAIGEHDGTQYNNYGIPTGELDLDMSQKHIYRLENRVSDGGNMVWLYIDGKEIGPMNRHYIGSKKDTGNRSDWISGQDFVFGYMGTVVRPISNCSLFYLEVWEAGKQEGISLRYDDHYDVTGKTVEIVDAGVPTSYQVGYGVAENMVMDTAVVTLEGNYLVATGIGTAIVNIDGETTKVTVSAAPVSLLLLIGQSNMRGSEGNADQSIVCPDGMVYATFGDDRGDAEGIMNADNATQFAASALTGPYSTVNVEGTTDHLSYYPLNSLTEDGKGTFGPDSGFAYEWVKQTGEKVWIVNAAHGGSAIKSWQDGATNFKECDLLFSACQETLRKEIAAGHFTLSHMGYFWCQGCSEATETAEAYVEKYLSMHESLKEKLTFDHDSDPATPEKVLEFAGIIPVRAAHDYFISYREGTYTDTTDAKYYESFKDLRFNGPRVAQYWMCNNPDLPDIWMVCNIGEDWVWMPDGTNGVSAYFQSQYSDGTVDYTTQVKQKDTWYTPTTPKEVHDSIHYNQIGYNEIGRESVRNALIMLEEKEAPNVETTVEFLSWDGYTPVENVMASVTGASGTLVVPKVSPVWKTKEVTYTLSDGLVWKYYDLLVSDDSISGTLTSNATEATVTATGHRWSEWERISEPSAAGAGEDRRVCADCDLVDTRAVNGVWQTYDLNAHLQELPENVCCDTNIWTMLPHEDVHFTSGKKWGKTSTPVTSITIPVNPGDRLFATSWQNAGINGHPTSDGIRLTFFDAQGIALTLGPGESSRKFYANGGYLEAPEGTIAINIAMWYDSEDYEVYILNRDHCYENGVCAGCGGEHPNLETYKDKVISILSASTSTFAGWIPEKDGFNLEHRARYPQDNLLTDVGDTWWHQLITRLDAKLGINDSWAGSQVLNTRDTNSGDLGPDAAMASLTRIQNLGANGTPDVILFFGGGNDMGRGVTLGSFDPATAPTEVDLTVTKWDTFADAYVAAIMRLKHFYPDSQILVMTSYPMPSYVTAAKLDKYGPVIRAICDHYGVDYVSLRDCGVSFDMLPDKIHPNAEGMDYITAAVMEKLLSDVEVETGAHTVYSVSHNLTNAAASLSYYKGISAGKSFEEEISGTEVTVTMGGEDITASAYADGKISIARVTGDLVITASDVFDADGHLQQLPEVFCCGTNLWKALQPEKIYYTATGWGNTSAGNSWSITFPVQPGDRIWATSMGAYPDNGSTANGIRVTWFDENGVLATVGRETVYAEFVQYGYITAPEGAVALNVPMTGNQDHYAVYILSAEHDYINGICSICGHDLRYPDWEIGTIANATGMNRGDKNRLRTTGYLKMEDYSAVTVEKDYKLVRFVYDENYVHLNSSDWLGDGVDLSVLDLRSQYPKGVYFRVALCHVDGRDLTLSALEDAGVTFYLADEEAPKPTVDWTEESVMNLPVTQDGAIYDGKMFALSSNGTGAVYDLMQKTKLGSFTLDKSDILNPHANSVCFSDTFYTTGDKYPLLYVNVYNNYSTAADRMEGTCCVYRLVEQEGEFTTELVHVIRIGFVEDLSLWKSKENNGDARPYGNFVVDTDKDELYAFVMRDATQTTRFFRFSLPSLEDGAYSEVYGCKVVTLEKTDILSWFDTPYMRYMQGCCYAGGKILSVEGFGAGTSSEPVLRIIDLQTEKEIRRENLTEQHLNKEPELVCIYDGRIYYASADKVLRILTLEGLEFEKHMPGDINGDGSVNNKDATRLFQYLTGWNVEVAEAALDVNGDGSVNNKDATRLFQYLSGWNVEIH